MALESDCCMNGRIANFEDIGDNEYILKRMYDKDRLMINRQKPIRNSFQMFIEFFNFLYIYRKY